MTVSWAAFWQMLMTSPALLITVLLTFGVIFVNGWTDAPNAIATCVATRAMRPRAAIVLAAIFNFFGVLVMSRANASVAVTMRNIANFEGNTRDSLVALCAALFAIVVWAVAAWRFGIPTSESHALIAGLSGAAIALHGGVGGLNGSEWAKVLYGLLLSTVLGFGMGFACMKLTAAICRTVDRRVAATFFRRAQIGGGAAMAFMHGAQDGQKFMGVCMLGIFLANGQGETEQFALPLWLMILCSAVMAIGTSVGGYRIMKAVGVDMVKLEQYQGFAADAAGAACLFLSTLCGVPVSTTHTKTAAVMGVGAAHRLSAVKWSAAGEMAMTWVLTFPGCGLIGFIMAKLFMLWF